MKQVPSFIHEQLYWKQGVDMVAGIDEVGMGALAGPVCAAAVVFGSEIQTVKNSLVRDSKLMTPKQREEISKWIKKNALAWAAGEASVEEIDRFNIRQASHLAMRRATEKLRITPELLLIDGLPAQVCPDISCVNIVNGDQLCYSIAAASILAKVYRDKIMVKLDRKYPEYKWASNKGYGSLQHKEALRRAGVSRYHRRSYAPVARCLA